VNKITDAFGREATQGADGIWRTDDGISVGPSDDVASVLSTLSGMAPEGWTPPKIAGESFFATIGNAG